MPEPRKRNDERVPFTVLTGFLGAGKTTVLNRMLAAPAGRRIAVLVNELGRIAIDSRLILSRGGDVLELAGGCVCCKVGDDLWDGVLDVIGRARCDHVVLETTGIAEPAAIFEGFDRLGPDKRGRILEAGVVCVVDADAGPAQIDRRDEARAQVETADRVLLSKLDVAAAEKVTATRARLGELNEAAEIAAFPHTDDGNAALTPWILDRRGRARRRTHRHHRGGQVIAAAYNDDVPLVADALLAVLDRHRDRLLRVKGYVALAGDERRGFLELAGTRTELRHGDPWGETPPLTELVLIGEDLDEAALRRQLWACRAGG